VQTCVVHLIRNSLRFASKKYWKEIAAEVKEIYQAPTLQAAEARFGEFAEHLEGDYPAMIQMWRRSWAESTPFPEFPIEVRKLIYTTNAIESLNPRFQQAVRRHGHFPNKQTAPTRISTAAPVDRGLPGTSSASGAMHRLRNARPWVQRGLWFSTQVTARSLPQWRPTVPLNPRALRVAITWAADSSVVEAMCVTVRPSNAPSTTCAACAA